jgi:hypothetical protein
MSSFEQTLYCFFHAFITQSLEPGFTVILDLKFALVWTHVKLNSFFSTFGNKGLDRELDFRALWCWLRFKSMDTSKHLLDVSVQRTRVFSHTDNRE